MIKSLTTLKTENSRLKEMILSKSKQIEEMNQQLQSVVVAKQNLHDLISTLFSKLESIKETKKKVDHVIEQQEEKAKELLEKCKSILADYTELCSKHNDCIQ